MSRELAMLNSDWSNELSWERLLLRQGGFIWRPNLGHASATPKGGIPHVAPRPAILSS